jgi:hypothetical protein
MQINGMEMGDEFELSSEEFRVLLKIIHERMKSDEEENREAPPAS